MDIANANVLVTGGANGIGRRLVDRLLDAKAGVAVLDIDRTGLSTLKQEAPEVTCIECDVTDAQDVARAVSDLDERLGGIDVLVNNAASLLNAPLVGFGPQGFTGHDVKAWDRLIATNLSSVFYVTVCVVEHMLRRRTRGVVVNMSSIGAAGNPGQSAYSATKAGVNALTVTWAEELGPMGIRVAAVAPGITDTHASTSSLTESALAGLVKRTPLKRLATIEEIVEGILFVIANDFFHGRTLQIDGGLRM